MIAAKSDTPVWSAFVCLVALLVLTSSGCNRKPSNNGDSFTADVVLDASAVSIGRLHGKLYLRQDHLCLDWGNFVEVFDLRKRTGWRAFPGSKVYQDLGDKELSTYAPLFTNGSMCPNAQVPSACKLVGKEEVDGRMANKWDVWNPRGFHVYYWTDERLAITLRSEIGETNYQMKQLREGFVWNTLFDLPSGYQHVQDFTKRVQ